MIFHMDDNIYLVITAGIMMSPVIIILLIMIAHDTNFFSWLAHKFSLKTLCIVIGTAFVCWHAYKARCAYENKCKNTIAAYERLVANDK